MGDMADYYMEIEMFEDFDLELDGYEFHYHNHKGYTVWTTAEGKQINIKKMTMTHLRNTLKMLMRMNGKSGVNSTYVSGFIESISNEIDRRIEYNKNNIVVEDKQSSSINKLKKGSKKMGEENKIKNVVLKAVGVTFSNDNGISRQNIISKMTKNSPIILTREPHNKFDTNAIAISTIDGQVGYIGKDYASIIAGMMDSGRKFSAVVDTVDEYKGTKYLSIKINEE